MHINKIKIKCHDCDFETEDPEGWYAQYTSECKIMRCQTCGEKERDRLYEMHFGDKRKFILTEDVNKNDRIEHAKDIREAGLSPWQFKQEQKE